MKAVLPDGTSLLVRAIRPDDRRLLAEAFEEHMSGESRYKRFLAATPALTPRMLRYLTEVDHHDHEALVAIDPATGAIVGEARWARAQHDAPTAEIAVAIVDEWQHRGVGSLLLERLTARARQEGVEHFVILMLAANEDMLGLLGHVGPVHVVSAANGTLEAGADVPAARRLSSARAARA